MFRDNLNTWACSCEWWPHVLVDVTTVPCGVEEQGAGSSELGDTCGIVFESESWIFSFCCCLCISQAIVSLVILVLALKWDFLKFQWLVILLLTDSIAPLLSIYSLKALRSDPLDPPTCFTWIFKKNEIQMETWKGKIIWSLLCSLPHGLPSAWFANVPHPSRDAVTHPSAVTGQEPFIFCIASCPPKQSCYHCSPTPARWPFLHTPQASFCAVQCVTYVAADCIEFWIKLFTGIIVRCRADQRHVCCRCRCVCTDTHAFMADLPSL